jgi:hypothetical protein
VALTIAVALPVGAADPPPQPRPCDPAKTVKLVSNARLTDLFSGSQTTCNSLATVFARLAHRARSGGRKLEPERGFDAVAAQRQLDVARANAEYRAEVTAAQNSETDPLRRAVLEAAVLDDFGHYQARDLLIEQVSRQLEGS